MSYDETYHDETTLVRLHCDGSECWADVRRLSLLAVYAEETELEFLLQPRNAAQLPIGPPMVLHVEPYRLQCDPGTRQYHAWSWLPPQLTPDLLNRCHLRLRAAKLESSERTPR